MSEYRWFLNGADMGTTQRPDGAPSFHTICTSCGAVWITCIPTSGRTRWITSHRLCEDCGGGCADGVNWMDSSPNHYRLPSAMLRRELDLALKMGDSYGPKWG